MNPKVKILISYHKPSVLFQDEVLTPIHLGRALNHQAHKDGKVSDEDFTWLHKNMIGDDTGENISHLNRYFNEMTGVYWAWKNYDKLGNPDYIGFMSYRCFFYLKIKEASFSSPNAMSYRCFNQNSKNELLPYYNFDNFSEFYWNNNDTQEILNLIKQYDYITNLPTISKKESVEEQYKNTYSISVGHIAEDIEILKNIITQNFPQYKQKFEEYLTGNENYFSNMFIMKKELFFEYCEFIFPILFKYHQSIDYSNRNLEQSRMFVSERLTGMFYCLLKQKYNAFKTPIAVIANTHLLKCPLPAFNERNIPIVFAVDNHYLPYLYVAITSLIENSNPTYNYDICILHTTLHKESKEKFNQLNKDNISVRFIEISSEVGKATQGYQRDILDTRGHMTSSTYFRFWIPSVFSNYKKIIYLDSDIIVLNNIQNLYETDLGNNVLGASIEVGIECLLSIETNNDIKKYLEETLKMQNIHHYFQAGVLIYDIQQCIQINFTQMCLEKSAQLKKPRMNDQCVLNSIFENQVKFLSLQWNYVWNIPIRFKNYPKHLPTNITNEIQQAQKNPCIIHYNDNFKPWSHPHLPLADIWWNYARKTPFYEEILAKLNINAYGAGMRVRNHLAYKLGSAMIKAKNPFKAIMLPITLIFLIVQHKIDHQIYKSVARINPRLVLPPLKDCSDYNQVSNIKKHLSYRLGKAMLKNPLAFPFKLKKIYKDFKNDKESNV
ncbi:DUF4422 domain-containing protein [Helicobacter rodentium]|uniref:DUF4422 domain-containing protein n=1 Tax=Helicobacter rodentium TaxID=59617 RepID=UPI0023578F98|nr:DUF4422 domain-containing protein [Helicobacter rodentium]